MVRVILNHGQGREIYPIKHLCLLTFFLFQSSSFIGPLVVGVISDLTGNIRYSFFFLVFMVWAAIPILMSVNVEQGRKDAQAYDYHSVSSSNVVDSHVNGIHI